MSKLTKAEKFKRKYQTDPIFRKLHIQRVTEYKRRKSREHKLQKEELKLERKQWREFKLPNGKVVECCRITFLASALGRKPKRVREWELEGRFPKTIRYKTQRYYTREHYNMVLLYCEKYKEYLNMFFVKVRENWNKYL